MLLILTTAMSNRLRYIADLMIRNMLGVEVMFTTSVDEFRGCSGPKFAYTTQPLPDTLNIEASGLLFDKGIRQQGLKPSRVAEVPVLFQSANPAAALPFDPFAAGFYMVSRYEEYLTHKKDSFGRFPATASIAWDGKFLDIPVVHIWSDMVGRLLKQHFPGLQLRHPKYRFVPTIDIDHAYCYRCRPLIRTLGGIGKSLLNARFNDVTHRMQVLAGMADDPYDTYDYIRTIHEQYAVNPLFFILFADYGGNDNNVTITSKAFRHLIRELDLHQGVGIHPSLSSNKHYLKLQAELDGLSAVLNRDVTNSRQHFLKLSVPKTYRSLIQLGISDDYSMGYASQPGFRAGISIPFPFFDITRDETTSLMIHPITLMDVTMKDYLRLTGEQSLEMIGKLIGTVKSVNGEFISLWHNESLTGTGRWLGWRRIFEEMVKLAAT